MPLIFAVGQLALADSEIHFRTSWPVVVLVAGRRATPSSVMDVRAANIEPGTHHVEVQSVRRKTICEGEVEVAD